LVKLIKEVKPGLGDRAVKLDDSVVEHLGLDSLDVLQLARKIRREIGAFDLDSWSKDSETHGRSVKSILDTVASAAA